MSEATAGSASRRGFWTIAAVLGFFLAAASVPSPLYATYAATWHFGPVTITVIFAVYAIALLTVLLTAGSLSDGIGRRSVIVAALAAQAVSMLLFLVAAVVTWLYAARAVQGAATGLVTAAVAAALIDLQPAARPGLGRLLCHSARNASPGSPTALRHSLAFQFAGAAPRGRLAADPSRRALVVLDARRVLEHLSAPARCLRWWPWPPGRPRA